MRNAFRQCGAHGTEQEDESVGKRQALVGGAFASGASSAPPPAVSVALALAAISESAMIVRSIRSSPACV